MGPEKPTREAVEEAANAIREAHHDSMKETVPTAKICRHSVPYWDEELSALHNERIRTREACR